MTTQQTTRTRYRVTAPYVTVHTASSPLPWSRGGLAEAYKGELLPTDAAAGDIAHLLRKGMIEAIEVPA